MARRGPSVSDTAAVTGDVGLIIALNHMKAASARRIMRPAITQALTPVLRTAKANVPTGDTKALKKSIIKKVGKARKGGISGMITLRGLSALKNSPATYGRYVEFGTAKMPPRPFMRSAMAENKATIKSILVRKGRERLKVEAAKARKKGKTL